MFHALHLIFEIHYLVIDSCLMIKWNLYVENFKQRETFKKGHSLYVWVINKFKFFKTLKGYNSLSSQQAHKLNLIF